MNDSSFSNYENYFCTSSHQVTEINPLTQSIEYDDVPATIHYINNVSSGDMVTTLTQSVSGVEQRHQQNNVFNFPPNSHDEQEKLEPQSVSKRVTAGSVVVSNVPASSTHFGGIPFVQIHTTNVQPQRTSYGNVFRRNISRQEEIKSEPIKSETSEAAKERTNATPTPPRTTNQTQNENNIEPMDTTANEKQSNSITNNNIEDKSSALIQIYKCSKCPFISLRETERDNHIASQHNENCISKSEQPRSINCPGCSNIFYHQESLQIHLKLDHLMREEDVPKLLNTFIESKKKSNEEENNASLETINKTLNTENTKEPIRKSRIYLKNVECLREPNRQPMEQTDNQLTGTTTTTNYTQQPTKPTAPKQKISIKSVDVLREPALLRRDYEMQNSNINNFLNFNTDLLNNTLDLLATSPLNLGNNTNSSSYDYPQTLDNSINKSNINNNDCSLVNSNTSTNAVTAAATEKPRRPKIYVKSVESFNLMPLDSLHTNNNGGFLNDHSTSCNNNQVYDTTLVHMPPPYMFDTNSSGNNLNNNANFISNHSDMDTFQFINTSNANNNNNNYILENTLFLGNSEELNVNGEQMENITLIPDDATPTPPSTADINMIMTKPVSTIQEQRGTLHLRTVDELNLMNKTEVQHLIAPNLDNNHTNEVLDKVNSSSLNDINLIGDDLYEDDHFKFHDLDTQMVNDWPETYEDLAEDINCIIADASNENSAENLVYSMENNNQKLGSNNFDIDTPQVSLITIRDIEELTGTANHTAIEQQPDLIVEQIQDSHNEIPNQIDIVSQEEDLLVIPRENESVGDSSLKRELVNATPESNETPAAENVKETNVNKEISKNVTSANELPPLVPVTNTSTESTESTNLHNSNVNPLTNSNIPLPPLVPVSPLIKLNKVVNKQPDKPTSPMEKGRIYVANNLMEPPKRPTAVSATSGTSVRGRPFGSNRTRITKLKQTIGSSAEDLFSKCSIKGCAFRFKKSETVEYHRKCHDMSSDSPQAMLCPECKSTEFNNWNTLHTHLWRAHQIDMELYKCELCEFKTPIFSRLVNTHAKIHFEDRNYKCEHCEKAFKNSKQLKNHRRWHRVQAATAITTTTPPKPTPTEIHRCSDCGSTFSQQKTLREHCCKKGDSSLKCNVCEKLMSSKSSLKLHLLTHSDGEKRYKCQNCDYATNDHNAFRRHRMGHENRKMYECNFCPYKSVQSVAYQKHILQKHPEKADSVIHKCSVCSYSTINRSLLVVHQAKHEKPNDDIAKSNISEESSVVKNTEKSVTASSTSDLQKSKIKVKSNLFTTNTTEAVVNVNHNDLNLVQLYNVESGSVT